VDSLLTLFNIDGVHNLLASLLGDLASVLLGVLVALLLLPDLEKVVKCPQAEDSEF